MGQFSGIRTELTRTRPFDLVIMKRDASEGGQPELMLSRRTSSHHIVSFSTKIEGEMDSGSIQCV